MRTTNPAKVGGLDTTGEIKISGGSGVSGQVIASQGPGVPPAFISPSNLGVDYGLSFLGVVTGIVGAPNFQCSGLIGFGNDYFEGYWACVVWDAGGAGAAPQGEQLVCTGYVSATGDFTVAAFSDAIVVGDKVLLFHPSIAQMAKLAGAVPGVGTSGAVNWSTAGGNTGTSGEAGEDLVTLGANSVSNKVLSLVLDISAVTAGSVITVKMFQQVNGVEKKVYSEGFVRQAQVQGSEPDGLWIIAGALGIHEALRVEVHSSANEAVAIAWDYMLEVM